VSTLGRPRVHLRRTDSTNERARTLALAGAPHGTLVTASEQTAGRGRQGRHWSAPAGSSLLMSLVLRSPPSLLPLIAAVAVCDVAGDETRIKWPNDIVLAHAHVRAHARSGLAGRGADAETEEHEPGASALPKLAGILAEGRPQQGWAVLGIGLNVAVRLEDLPVQLRPAVAGSLPPVRGRPAATLGKGPEEIEPTLERLLSALERRLNEPAKATLEAWRARDALRGREIVWTAGRGRAEGIDGAGRLVVALADGGWATLDAGEVHLGEIG
jgi:BirA family biotin operon repressor/biotin-[acetyl-CoA-carboxylase] ligase